MNILHLANDFSGSSVYKNLCESIDKSNIPQTIYVPVRSKFLIDQNRPNFHTKNSSIIYRHILNAYTRFNYFAKVSKITVDIQNSIDMSNISLIHAHTWYSDGAVAYRLFKKYDLPYIVTIRNTDLNLFSKYMLHLRGYGKEILTHARQIIFISPTYCKRFFQLPYLRNDMESFKAKSIIVPNGIDDFWFNNVFPRKTKTAEIIQLIFVGRILKSKNLLSLISAVKNINQFGSYCHLTIVGGHGNAINDVLKSIKDDKSFTFRGEIKDRSELLKLYRDSDIFTMPSKSETFGLVYLEALSQGIPIVFTKGEGIDGLFDTNIGEAVDCNDLKDIENGIKTIANNYQNYDFIPTQIISHHLWSKISNKYLGLYNRISK